VTGILVRRGVLPVLIVSGGLLLAHSCGGDSPAAANPPTGGNGEWKPVWSDEFDSGSTPALPDSSHWGYEEGYVRNQEWQYYTDDIRNAHVQDGLLHLEAHKREPGTYPSGPSEGQDGSISSASLTSRGRVQFRYGRLEMRARIDTRLGSWPAFWTLGAGGPWPDGGECDIMEYYKETLLFNVAYWKAGDAPWTPRWDSEKVSLDTLPSDWADQFHVWAMEWDTEGVRLFMDDVLYNEWDSSVDSGDGSIEGFQQEHYVILNQAIGGKAGGDASGIVYPTRYEVDYVRLYEWVANE
jgi:beta-glucanase (GH16 family)